MLRYFGRITMNERFTGILNIAQDLMGLIESVYAENIESEVFSITINDEFIVEELKKAETEWERNEIIQKCKDGVTFHTVVIDYIIVVADFLKHGDFGFFAVKRVNMCCRLIAHSSLPPKCGVQEIHVNTSQVCRKDSTKVRVLRRR